MNKFMSQSFDQDRYKHMITKSREDVGMQVVNSTPEISGGFSAWKPLKMIPVFEFWEYISRNGLPSTRFYVESDGSMYNKLARAFSRDIQLIMKNRFCLRKVEQPTVYKIRDAILAERRAVIEEEQRILDAIEKAKVVKKETEKSKASINEDLNVISEKGDEPEGDKDAFSSEEEEEDLGFEKWMDLIEKYLSKENAFQIFNLRNISKLHYNTYSICTSSP